MIGQNLQPKSQLTIGSVRMIYEKGLVISVSIWVLFGILYSHYNNTQTSKYIYSTELCH